MRPPLLVHTTLEPGIERHTLRLDILYPGSTERTAFEKRWRAFFASHTDNAAVFRKAGNRLIYKSECLIPSKTDKRPACLLVFGNPAPQSVASKMYFSYEGNGKEHRVWKAFRDCGLLEFKRGLYTTKAELLAQNAIMKQNLFDLQYKSPYLIGMAVFFAMPSSASDPKWSGVAGLRRLFGAEALTKIAAAEQYRLRDIIATFLSKGGTVLAFQRDAYENLRDAAAPSYALKQVIAGTVQGAYPQRADIRLTAVPPTRLLLGKRALQSLRNAIQT